MKTQTFTHADFDGLAAEAIGLGGALAAGARHLHLGTASTEGLLIGRCLSKLAARRPFGHGLDGGLDAVGQNLERELAHEILCFEERCLEVGYGEDGPQYAFEMKPIYSERGAELLKLQDLFLRFRAARNVVLDHLAARQVLP